MKGRCSRFPAVERDIQRVMRVERMGRVGYGPMLALQEQRHHEVAAGKVDDTLFLLEHDPVVTLGRNARSENVLSSAPGLRQQGIEVFTTGRGGDVTYHGPGQVVGYPVVALVDDERDIKRYVASLEEIMIRTARDFGIDAWRQDGLRGVWVDGAKLGAVGVRIAGWVTLHGFALNVAGDLFGFNFIVPCGLAGKPVTSLERLLGQAPPWGELEDRLSYHAGAVLDRRVVARPPSALTRPLAVSA